MKLRQEMTEAKNDQLEEHEDFEFWFLIPKFWLWVFLFFSSELWT